MDDRLQQLVGLVDQARRLGARGSEVLLASDSGWSVKVQRGKAVSKEELARESLTVRCWTDGGRRGDAHGTPEQALALVQQAIEASADQPEDPFAGPVGRLPAAAGGLGVDDRRYGSVQLADRIEVAAAAERSVRAVDRRLSASDFRYQDTRTLRCFANSKGVVLGEWSTLYRASGTVTASYMGDPLVLPTVHEARTFASVASVPFGTNLARRAVALFKNGPTLEGEVRVMFAPAATARLFSRLGHEFRADAFANGSFFLQPRDDGSRSVDRRIHLVDDGAMPGALRTRAFDDRGVSAVPLTLLREGVVHGRFLDPREARRLETRPTGHVWGDELRASNLMLRSGSRSMNAILTDLGGWVLLVRDLHDLGGLDTATGHFRCQVSGSVMKGNKPEGAVRNAILEGDLSVVLNKVVEFASDTDRVGHVDAPGMLVDGFTLTPG